MKKINLIRRFASPLYVGTLLALSGFTAQAALLGVVPETPLFNYNSGGTTTFDSLSGSLSVSATPFEFTPAGGPPSTIYPLTTTPSVSLNIFLDTGWALLGGDPGGDDLSVSGDIDSNGDFIADESGVLLTAEIVSFGFDEFSTPTAASFDFLFTVTGGALVASGDYALGSNAGMTLTVEGNNFDINSYQDWAGGAKGTIGSVVPVPAAIWLFGSGLFGLATCLKKRGRS